MQALTTILPLFLIIGLGWCARGRGFIPDGFLGPANRLAYYFAIPALVFRAVSRASLTHDFHGGVILCTLSAAAVAYGGVWLFCRLTGMPARRAGGLIQSAGHGNLGYIGLPFAFYYLGDVGLVKAGIIAGFLMILQNILSVSVLQSFAADRVRGGTLSKIVSNPVIVSSLLGILVSASGLTLPDILQRTLDILGGLALPMALLLIGASISAEAMRDHFPAVLVSVLTKLFLLPAIGLAIYITFGIPSADYLPGLILLASPTATVAYVMAREMDGDADFVTAAISTSTLVSSLSFFLWLALFTASQ
jgi:predicted permease